MIPLRYITEEQFRYQPLSAEELYELAKKIEESVEKYKKNLISVFGSIDIQINYPMLYRIFERIDQRRDYYLYFHSNHEHSMQMSQAKETALFSYWLIKYKPITCVEKFDEYNFFNNNGYTVNELFATFFLISFIIGLDEKNSQHFDLTTISTLTYSLSNREVSKEALILYVESFLFHKTEMGGCNVWFY